MPFALEAEPAALTGYLAAHGWIDEGEQVRAAAPAGDGNMNLTLRVTTTSRRLIVKQGRPWVHKYPSIAAPEGRTVVEAEWYALAATEEVVAARLPSVLGLAAADRVLLLEDLGETGDLTGVYAGRTLSDLELEQLVGWLAALHDAFRGDARAAAFHNRDMRLLNHEHIFEVPLRPDNGLDLDALTPGLGAEAGRLAADPVHVRVTAELGAAYLGEQPLGGAVTLLHGDYYPASWLQGPDAPMVIDPEFGFGGPPEFDLGVMLAHLALSSQPAGTAEGVAARYEAAVAAPVDLAVAWGFAGVEVTRRLLGVSQLPVRLDLAAKRALLDAAHERIVALA